MLQDRELLCDMAPRLQSHLWLWEPARRLCFLSYNWLWRQGRRASLHRSSGLDSPTMGTPLQMLHSQINYLTWKGWVKLPPPPQHEVALLGETNTYMPCANFVHAFRNNWVKAWMTGSVYYYILFGEIGATTCMPWYPQIQLFMDTGTSKIEEH